MKIKLIKNSSPEKLVEEVNDFFSRNKVVASPIIYSKNNFNCFIYYEESKYLDNEKPEKKFSGFIKNPDSPATESQIKTLGKLGYKIESKLTKGQASKIIDALIKEKRR